MVKVYSNFLVAALRQIIKLLDLRTYHNPFFKVILLLNWNHPLSKPNFKLNAES